MAGMVGHAAVIACAGLFLQLAAPSSATVYTVGDTNGWAMGVDYSTWTSDKEFLVGDSLQFNYGGMHTVDEVSKSDYSSCTVGNSITTDSSGSTAIPLKTEGDHYFICGAMGHCGSGMKLAVTVKSSSSSSSGTTPSTIPAGGDTTASPTSGATTTTPTTSTTTTSYKPESDSAGKMGHSAVGAAVLMGGALFWW